MTEEISGLYHGPWEQTYCSHECDENGRNTCSCLYCDECGEYVEGCLHLSTPPKELTPLD